MQAIFIISHRSQDATILHSQAEGCAELSFRDIHYMIALLGQVAMPAKRMIGHSCRTFVLTAEFSAPADRTA